jgi:hypothetical protein
MASSEGIAAADLVEKVPSSRQVRYEGRVMNIEAVQCAEKEMDEAETAVEQEHQLAMKGVAEEEAALRLRLQTILARKEALAQREADLKARLQAEKLRVAENTAASASSVHDRADLDDVELLEEGLDLQAGRQVGAAQIGAPPVGSSVIPIEVLVQQRVELVMQEQALVDLERALETSRQKCAQAALARAEDVQVTYQQLVAGG